MTTRGAQKFRCKLAKPLEQWQPLLSRRIIRAQQHLFIRHVGDIELQQNEFLTNNGAISKSCPWTVHRERLITEQRATWRNHSMQFCRSATKPRPAEKRKALALRHRATDGRRICVALLFPPLVHSNFTNEGVSTTVYLLFAY